jgi:glutathione peroxidase
MRCLAFVAVLAVAGCQGDAKPKEADPEGAPPPKVEAPAKAQETPPVAQNLPAAIWDTPIHTLDGKPTTLGEYKGKAILVVNVASQCGLTPQYTQLEALQDRYAAKGFTVLGFPCNQFGGQEPGSAEEIQEFCSTKYGVSFPLMEKIEVNGDGRHPIYKELTQVADASGHQGDIRWNFEKFVISADGTSVTRFNPKVKPDDPTVVAAIEQALP